MSVETDPIQIALAAGRADEALALARKLVDSRPADASPRQTLGRILAETGDLDGAVAQFHLAIRLAPTKAEAYLDLGGALRRLGRLDEARDVLAVVHRAAPDFVPVLIELGEIALAKRDPAEAKAMLLEALSRAPDHPRANADIARLLMADHQFVAAERHLRKAIAAAPEQATPHGLLAEALYFQGRVADAVVSARRHAEMLPGDAVARTAYLFTLSHDAETPAADLWAAHRAFDRDFGRPLSAVAAPYANDRDPDRRLTVGFVSPDFWRHPVAWFFLPVLEGFDPARTRSILYADVGAPDAMSRALAASADGWVDISRMSDAAVAERMRADHVDVLVDLAGHASGRMLLFARRPAPVQISWLGYLGGPGLGAFDARITDVKADPAPLFDDDPFIALDDPFMAFRLEDTLPPVPPPPCLTAGHVTFGSFNKLGKINRRVMALWARLLAAVPDARLVLKAGGLGDEGVADGVKARLAALGVAPERVETIGYVRDHAAHLALYDKVDIALDPFPWEGGTTTCEALSMGRPVVTLAKPGRPFRMGASLVGWAGLDDLVARDEDDYLRIAAALAGDRARLAALSEGMRARLRASPLTDPTRLARNLEDAWRGLWRRFVV